MVGRRDYVTANLETEGQEPPAKMLAIGDGDDLEQGASSHALDPAQTPLQQKVTSTYFSCGKGAKLLGCCEGCAGESGTAAVTVHA